MALFRCKMALVGTKLAYLVLKWHFWDKNGIFRCKIGVVIAKMALLGTKMALLGVKMAFVLLKWYFWAQKWHF